MREILFVQGAGEGVHEHWDDKLVDSLRRGLGAGYVIRYPLMPNEADPDLDAWRAAIDSALTALPDGAIVIGHSLGGAVLIDVLATRTVRHALRAIILIAVPFIGPGGWSDDAFELRSEVAQRLSATVPVLLYHGEQDDTVDVSHLALYAVAIAHARARRLPNRDHQLNDDLSEIVGDIRNLDRAGDRST